MNARKCWPIICILALGVVFPPLLHAANEAVLIEDVKIDTISETPEIYISSNIPVEYIDYTLDSPHRIIIDPLGMVYTSLDEQLFTGKDLVQAVTLVKAPGEIPSHLPQIYYPLDFIVIQLQQAAPYDILREEKLVVRIGRTTPAAQAAPMRRTAPAVQAAPARRTAPRARPARPGAVAEAEEVVELPTIDVLGGEIAAEEEFAWDVEEGAPPVGEEFIDEDKFPLQEKYRLEAGDELEISVWQHADLLRKVVVRPDGYISFPLAGEIKTSGMTAKQLSQELALRLGRKLRKPEVSVIVTGFGSKGIFVLGAVRKPGLYPYKTRMTILSAISSADSWLPQAHLKSVLLVKRGFSEDAEVARVNMWDVIKYGKFQNDREVEPGDIVYVPQSFIGNLGDFMDALRFRFGTGYYISSTTE
jgi:polysaccharide export outer membrane protein